MSSRRFVLSIVLGHQNALSKLLCFGAAWLDFDWQTVNNFLVVFVDAVVFDKSQHTRSEFDQLSSVFFWAGY